MLRSIKVNGTLYRELIANLLRILNSVIWFGTSLGIELWKVIFNKSVSYQMTQFNLTTKRFTELLTLAAQNK